MPDLDITPPAGPPAIPPSPPIPPPSPFPTAPPPAPTGATGGKPADSHEYADIFVKPKGSRLKTIGLGLLVLLVMVGLAGAANKFVFDFGLGSILPFLAKESSPPAATQTTTSGTESVTTESATVTEAKQRDLKRQADLALIQSALSIYQAKNGAFPPTVGRIKLNEAGNSLGVALVPIFLQAMPADPQDPQFSYQYQSDGQTYKLSSIIEDSTDPHAKSAGSFYFYELIPENSTATSTSSTATIPSQ